MENKKNPRLDLQRWNQVFLNLGLLIAVGTVLAAFEWKAYEEKPPMNLEDGITDWDILDIPITIQEPPRAPDPVVIPQFKPTPDDIVLDDLPNFDLNVDPTTELPSVILDSVPPTIENADEIFDFTEVQASFVGGMQGWYEYLKKNLVYPKMEQRAGREGTVILSFVVNIDGSIEDVVVRRSAGEGLDEAAKKVIEASPKWEPGRFRGKAVRSRMTIPIRFKLN